MRVREGRAYFIYWGISLAVFLLLGWLFVTKLGWFDHNWYYWAIVSAFGRVLHLEAKYS